MNGDLELAFVDYAHYQFIRRTVGHLASQGRAVHYVYSGDFTSPNYRHGTRTAIHEIEICAALPFSKEKLALRLGYEIEWSLRLLKYLRRHRPRTVVISNAPLPVVQVVASWCKRTRSRFIFWVQDFHSMAVQSLLPDGSFIGSLLIRVVGSWEARLLVRADHVVLISEAHAEKATSMGADAHNLSILPNWAVLEDFPRTPKANYWALEHGLARTRNVLYAGTIGMKHNLDLLLELARALKREEGHRLVIVSEGASADHLRTLAASRDWKHVRVLPFQPAHYLPSVLSAADVLTIVLTPSASQYSVPSKTYAYMCAGRPIVASTPTDNAASRLLMESGCGICIPPNDVERYLETVVDLLGNERTAKEMGRRGRAYAEANLSASAVASRLLAAVSHDDGA